MTDKQSEALRWADEFEATKSYMGAKAAAELRRLHEENQQWQEKCNTYIQIHDAVVKDNERLHEVNAELVEALREMVEWYAARDTDSKILPALNQNPEIYEAMQVLAKVTGEQQ
jgi:hypothetical protein